MTRQAGVSREAAEAAIDGRLIELRQRRRVELEALPRWSSDETTIDGKPVTMTTYREKSADGELRIVVQVSTRPKPFLMIFSTKQVFAGGIALSVDGTVHSLPQDQLDDYR